jgi:hypothetical protein
VLTPSSKLLLDTQATSHIIANAELIDDIGTAGINRSISVQGITKEITHVTLEGTLKTIGIPVYHSPYVLYHITANILSLCRTTRHTCHFVQGRDVKRCTRRKRSYSDLHQRGWSLCNGPRSDRESLRNSTRVAENISGYNNQQRCSNS